MKRIIGLAVCACVVSGGAWAECSQIGLSAGQTCQQAGGQICGDGTCRVCCPSSGGSSTTICTGTYTTDTSTTFSTVEGSGYIEKRTYRANCACPKPVV